MKLILESNKMVPDFNTSMFFYADFLFLFYLHDKETREVEETKKLPKHLEMYLQKI